MRKVTVNIETALANPNTVFAFQYGDETCKVASVRRTRTGRPVVTFDNGNICRYNGSEDVWTVAAVADTRTSGKPTITGPVRGWSRY